MLIQSVSGLTVDQILQNRDGLADRDPISHVVSIQIACVKDADDLALRVDDHAAALALIGSSVCLELCKGRSVFHADLNIERADDTGSDRDPLSKGIADRDGGLTDLQLIRASKDGNLELIQNILLDVIQINRNHGQISPGVRSLNPGGSDQIIRIIRLRREGDRHLRGILHNVVVGRDQELIVILCDDESAGVTLNLILPGLSEPVDYLLNALFRYHDDRGHHGLDNTGNINCSDRFVIRLRGLQLRVRFRFRLLHSLGLLRGSLSLGLSLGDCQIRRIVFREHRRRDLSDHQRSCEYGTCQSCCNCLLHNEFPFLFHISARITPAHLHPVCSRSRSGSVFRLSCSHGQRIVSSCVPNVK